jgi:hypothetical protein
LLNGCLTLAGCQKTIYICNQPIQKIGVIEIPASPIHPAQFYLCGNDQYPCVTIRYCNRIHHQQKRKAYEKPSAKQNCIIQ